MRSPKLLFLARPFPPLRATACVRTWNIAQFMARQGWQVTIVTPDPRVWRRSDGFREFEVALHRNGIHRILTEHDWRCLSPTLLKSADAGISKVLGGACRYLARKLSIDSAAGWIKPAERACSHLTSEDVDIILASVPPFSACVLAERLSKTLHRPYVLDYRDLWSRNAHDPKAAAFETETELLNRCRAVTTVSPSWANVLRAQADLDGKVHVITNGYDPDDLSVVEPLRFDHFAIVYTGIFYPPKRVITPVMAALQRLKSTNPTASQNCFFHYYGNHTQHVQDEARRYNIESNVILHGNVPRQEALSAVKGSDLALVITCVSEEDRPEDNGIIPAKIYEAIGLRTQVILIAPPNSDARTILDETHCGRSFIGDDTEGIATYLNELILYNCSNQTRPELYSWSQIIKRLDHILRAAAYEPALKS